MKVLHQLIKHFWQRGALTTEQAKYLVEHGFIRAHELGFYEPPIAQADQEETTAIDMLFPSVELEPDLLDDAQAKLSAPATAKRKGSSRAVSLPDYSPAHLGTDLRNLLEERSAALAALAKLADPRCADAAALRKLSPSAFRQRMLLATNAAPGVLAKIWEAVDPEPFHALLAQPQARGQVARAFEAILTATTPGAWGTAAWLLKVPEVQTVANLMAIRWQLLLAIRWLYEKHRNTLDRACRRPARPTRSWPALGFGLVLLHNARAWRSKRKPAGYVLNREPTAGWPEAWTTAINLDAELVIPYCVHLFGSVPGRGGAGKADFALKDLELICPSEWKV